jgi:hypothetical protein
LIAKAATEPMFLAVIIRVEGYNHSHTETAPASQHGRLLNLSVDQPEIVI